MITAEDVQLSKHNIDLQTAKKYEKKFHFKSFVIGLAVGISVSLFILISTYASN